MQALYTHEEKSITEDDFVNVLRKIGIREGDVIFVHSDIKVFGKIAAPDKNILLHGLVSALERSVGEDGTVVMPTFSYSFCKGEVYDKAKTRSTVGVLTDFFRTEPGVVRSIHPLFSVAAWGKHREEFLKTPKDSFGEGTSFDVLKQLGGKIILLGTDFQACTFLHYLEQMHRVPYRFNKNFSGTIVDGETSYSDTYSYFVRPLDGTIENDFNVIAPYLRAKGIVHEALIGSGSVLAVSAPELFQEGMQLLDKNPYLFVA